MKEQSIAFLGLGLISGSLAGALRGAGWQGELLAWGPRAPSLERGLELGLIDRFTLDLEAAVASADMVVIGAPPKATADLLPQVLSLAVRGTRGKSPVVTDIASIKGWIVDAADPGYSRFVPGHPIAGSEHSGVDAAQASLFDGREVILTPLANSEPEAVEAVSQMWRLTGARITTMSVSEHDAVLAASSHMPHMLAYALTGVLDGATQDAMKHGGGALRDMTRIAASDPLMWREIALTNRASLLDAIDAFDGQLSQLREWIANADGDALDQFFTRCQAVRRAHDAILNPIRDHAEAKK